MSFTAVSGVNGQYSSGASGTTYAIGAPSSTIPAGSTIVGVWVANVASETVSSIVDNSTQAGAANTYAFSLGVASGLTLSVGMFWCLKTTRAILSTDTVNITIGTAAVHRAACLNAWTPGNANPAFNTANSGSVVSASVSPVSTGGFGSPAAVSDGLGVTCGGVLTNSATSGYANTTSGFTQGVHPASPGGTPTVECWLSWKDNVGLTSFVGSATFTAISRAHAFAAIFTDTAPAVPKRNVTRVPNAWAGG